MPPSLNPLLPLLDGISPDWSAIDGDGVPSIPDVATTLHDDFGIGDTSR